MFQKSERRAGFRHIWHMQGVLYRVWRFHPSLRALHIKKNKNYPFKNRLNTTVWKKTSPKSTCPMVRFTCPGLSASEICQTSGYVEAQPE